MSVPILINESGMQFAPFTKDKCFHIEKSNTYAIVKNGVKIAEFILLRRDNTPQEVWIVEAKSSFSNPNKKDGKYEQNVVDVREKMSNTLSLLLAMCLKRHPSAVSELPPTFQNLDLALTEFVFVLILKDHPEGNLAPARDDLSIALRATEKIWALNPSYVIILNENTARERGLVQRSSAT